MTWSAFLLQSSIYLLFLFGIYWLLLRRATFFQLNRIVLLGIIALVIILPLAPAPSLIGEIEFAGYPLPVITEITDPVPTVTTPTERTSAAASPSIPSNKRPPINPIRILGYLYLIGVAVFGGRFLFQTGQLFAQLAKGTWIKEGKHYLAFSHQPIPPFSFFRFIMLNHSLYSTGTTLKILEHEKVHSRQWHSLDILAGELFTIIFWFHPLAWGMAKIMRINLEFIADREVLRNGEDPKAYQYSLLEVGTQCNRSRLLNHFNHSIIKNRVIMMNTKQSPEHARLRYLLLLPFVFLLFSLVNVVFAQETTPQPEEKPTPATTVTAPRPAAKASKGISASGASDTHTVTTAPRARGIGTGTGVATVAAPTATGTSVGIGTTAPTASESGISVGSTAPAATGIGAGTGVATAVAPQTSTGGVSVSADTPQAYTVTPGNSREKESVMVIIRSGMKEQDLKDIKADLKKRGINFSYPKLKYNEDGKITHIEVKVTAGDSFNANTFSYNENGPIEDPIIFYRYYGENGGYGLSRGISDNMPEKLRKIAENESLNGVLIGVYREE